jgi:hypothetical protein
MNSLHFRDCSKHWREPSGSVSLGLIKNPDTTVYDFISTKTTQMKQRPSRTYGLEVSVFGVIFPPKAAKGQGHGSALIVAGGTGCKAPGLKPPNQIISAKLQKASKVGLMGLDAEIS